MIKIKIISSVWTRSFNPFETDKIPWSLGTFPFIRIKKGQIVVLDM